jgi:hypothetical protein
LGFFELMAVAGDPDQWHELATANAVLTIAERALTGSGFREDKVNAARRMLERVSDVAMAHRVEDILNRATSLGIDDEAPTILAARLVALAVLFADGGRHPAAVDVLNVVIDQPVAGDDLRMQALALRAASLRALGRFEDAEATAQQLARMTRDADEEDES